MFPPLLARFEQEFEIAVIIAPSMPRWLQRLHMLHTVRWPRVRWYRAWRHAVEKTPGAFRATTRATQAKLAPLQHTYDAIFFFGAMSAPGTTLDKPLFVFTDSCRWLSSRNRHDTISHFKSPREEAQWLELEGGVYRAARRVFCGTEFVGRALVSAYGLPPGNVVVTGLGAGSAFGEPYEKQFDGKTIFYIGKGDFERKGGVVLIKAFERVRREIPGATLHIVGQDSLPSSEGIISHGFVRDRQKILELMRSAHVFSLPSLIDRNPISVLEAMASGTPVVASDYGAIPELVGEAGLTAPCGDVDATANALLTILRDSTLAARMGAVGRQRYLNSYNWESVWQKISREIQVVLGPLARADVPKS